MQARTSTPYLSDVKTQSAVLHQLMVLGEAVKRVSKPLRDAHPEVPWKEIAGSRDVLIHAYDSVDLGAVWKAGTEDVPPLIAALFGLAPSLANGPGGEPE